MKQMNIISLEENNLTKLTESDLIALCYLNNIKPDELEILNLGYNKLTNLKFITKRTPFINLKELNISNTFMTDINNIQYLKYLEKLDLNYSNSISNINLIVNLINLKELYLNLSNLKNNDITFLKSLVNLEILDLRNNYLKIKPLINILKYFKNLKEFYILKDGNFNLEYSHISEIKTKFPNIKLLP